MLQIINKVDKWFYLILLLSFFVLLYLSIPFYSGDVTNHNAWAKSILEKGTSGFYSRSITGFYPPNYPPITTLLFTECLFLYKSLLNLFLFLNLHLEIFPSRLIPFMQWENTQYAFLKLPAILANIFIAWGIYLIAPLIKNFSRKGRVILSLLFLFNPVTIYVSAIWGQIDFLPLAFLIFSFFFYLKTRPYLASVMMALSLLSKQTVLIFLPIFIYLIFRKFGFLTTIKSLLIIWLSFYILFSPFFLSDPVKPVSYYVTSLGSGSDNASEDTLNFWGLALNFAPVVDKTTFGLLTYQQWGFVLFGLFTLFPGLILIKKWDDQKYLLSFLFYYSLVYFFFFTRLHERHLAPAILFLTFMPFFSKKYWFSLFGITFIYQVNLYRGMLQPDIKLFNYILSTFVLVWSLIVTFYLIILFHLAGLLNHRKDNNE